MGDRVLGLLLAEFFYTEFPDEDEGALSIRLHSEARMSTLAEIGHNLGLADFIKSQDGLNVVENDGVLADVVESIMAGIYLDGGLDAARNFLHRHWPLSNVPDAAKSKDAKSLLQEWTMQRRMELPVYRLITKVGPDHAPEMTYEVEIEGHAPQSATANSRKVAEQSAAAALLANLEIGKSDE